MSKINFDAAILDAKGEPMVEREKGADGKADIERPVTLGVVVANAMLANMPEDNRLDSTKKVEMFKVAMKAQGAGTQDTTIEELATIKDRVGKVYGTLIVGRAFELLEGPESEAKAEKGGAVAAPTASARGPRSRG